LEIEERVRTEYNKYINLKIEERTNLNLVIVERVRTE